MEYLDIIGKKAKVLIDISVQSVYSPSTDPYYLQFKGVNSKRKRVGIIISKIENKEVKQNKDRSSYKYTIQYDNGDIIKDLNYRNIEVVE